MVDHITIPVTDIDRSKSFYAAALAPLGYSVHGDFDGHVGLGDGQHVIPDLWLNREATAQPVHIAFRGDRRQVDEFHRAALEAGGTDNGAPGIREHYHEHYYAAFVYDPDGHNVEAVCHMPD